MEKNKHLYAVILAGGGGTRLWPKSREETPKQFLKLFGEESLIQLAFCRVTKLVDSSKVIVVTNEKYKKQIEEHLPQVEVENIIFEPEKRDTAMAMLVGALFVKNKDKDAIIINSASDHIVEDEMEFVKVMNYATSIAEKGKDLVTVGIVPQNPDTGFGYIKIGKNLARQDGLNLFKVENFTEKPNKPTAIAFLASGNYFWNANMYVWKASVLEDGFEKHKKDFYDLTRDLIGITNIEKFHKILKKIYGKIEKISIDYAISEKSDNLVLIPGDFGWNDVGNWGVIYDLSKKDLSGNVMISDNKQTNVLTINSQRNLIHTKDRLIATVGVDDLAIIDTGEILLIMPRKEAQDVKKIVERLKEEKNNEYL
jgi:mannose-1-phosphate guanylyltransferase